MKRLILILILTIFSTTVFAEEEPREWKWEKVYNSIVLVSSENTYEEIIKEGIPEEFFEQPPGPNKNDKANPIDPQEFEKGRPKFPEFAMGTGFFINKIHVVTNYHVIKNFDSVKLYAYNHPFAITDVKIIGYDEEIDIAVIEILEDIENSYIPWADTQPYIGDTVYALGHGISQIWSLTKGILSYDYRPNPGTSFVHYIQTDAVINSGNSGGPLLNEDGEVVGINTLLISPDQSYVGYGYVIPTKLAKRAVEQILATGKHVKPSIGILMGIIDDKKLYKELREKNVEHFLEIKEVTPDSAAYRFGLMAGDIIVSIDGEKIYVVPHVIETLWMKNPGEQVSFEIYRNNEYLTIEVVLGTAPPIPSIYKGPLQ